MKLIAKIALKFFLLIAGTQLIFWMILWAFPETNSRNIGQEIGYKYIDQTVHSKEDKEYPIVVTGDSSAATAIHVRRLDKDALILGVWGSSPAEVYYYVTKYLENHPAPKCLLYTHLNAPDYYEAHAFWDFVVTYSDLPISYFSEIYEKSKELGSFPGAKYSKLVFFTKYYLYKYRFFLFTQDIYIDKLRYGFIQKKAFMRRWKMITNNNGEYIKKTQGEGLRGDWWTFLQDPFKKDPFFDHYLNKLFETVTSKGIKLYTFAPPMSQAIYAKYNSRLTVVENYMKETTEKFPNALYLPIKGFYKEDSYIDMAHLNLKGAYKFTTGIADQIDCLPE